MPDKLESEEKSREMTSENIKALLGIILEQFETAENYGSPLDDVQPVVHEYLYQSGGQLMFVLHLDQTSNGVSLSCTDGSPVLASPLAFDTVFSIAEYKFTKSTDMIFSLLKKGTNNHPWFLRPVLVQCSFDFMVISYEKTKGFDKISCHMI